jgi:FkbM family methyltransferase
MIHSAKSEPTSTFSLEGTDLILSSLLRQVEKGNYLDIGANHPINISNTYLFYQRGWRGVAVDGHDKFLNLWKQFRPDDRFCEAVVSDSAKRVDFRIFPDDTMGSINKETSDRYEARFSKANIKTRVVTTTTIFDVWREYGSGEVHLLSIDIEGEELNALRGANLKSFRPGVIAAEIKNVSLYAPLADPLVSFLTDAGYRLVAKTPLDSIFVDPTKDYLSWMPRSLTALS